MPSELRVRISAAAEEYDERGVWVQRLPIRGGLAYMLAGSGTGRNCFQGGQCSRVPISSKFKKIGKCKKKKRYEECLELPKNVKEKA